MNLVRSNRSVKFTRGPAGSSLQDRGARLVATAVTLAVVLGLGACGSGKVREDPILRLSAQESLEEGKRRLEAKKFTQARKYLSHAFEVEPNSASGREALLLVADAYYLDGGAEYMIQAEAKYRDFLNRFPTSDRTAYVQFQIGNSLLARLERPDRDQSATEDALEAYQELLRLYPGSEYEEQALAQIDALRQRLAEHEFVVAYFYWRYGWPPGVLGRLQHLLDEYPEYHERDKAYYYMGMSLKRLGKAEEAREWFDKLRDEYPESKWNGETPSAE